MKQYKEDKQEDLQEEVNKELETKKAQHFLVDKKAINKLIEAANIKKEDRIIEIGPGTGNITKALAQTGAKITSFEVDPFFTDELDKIEEKHPNVEIVYANALDNSWDDYNKIVSNIPFHLAELIIMKTIKSKVKELILIVGSHFKNKLFSEEKVALITKKAFTMEAIDRIDSISFSPPPNTNAWIIKLTKKEMSEEDKRIVGIALSPSKIKNAIIHALMKDGKTKKQSKEIVSSMKLSEDILNKSAKKITSALLIKLEEKLNKI